MNIQEYSITELECVSKERHPFNPSLFPGDLVRISFSYTNDDERDVGIVIYADVGRALVLWTNGNHAMGNFSSAEAASAALSEIMKDQDKRMLRLLMEGKR